MTVDESLNNLLTEVVKFRDRAEEISLEFDSLLNGISKRAMGLNGEVVNTIRVKTVQVENKTLSERIAALKEENESLKSDYKLLSELHVDNNREYLELRAKCEEYRVRAEKSEAAVISKVLALITPVQ